ncbi:methylmalonyl-CoA mutase family protein [Peribacillus sp. SCS-155]|uniref:methylmalonyl-CoA mutase family protein n=1 Tax=Peribacillus sedimenti TaxID=3115297 RepID=UPI003906389E
MKFEDVKKQSFPTVSIEEWKEAAESSMKGKSVASLVTDTYEGITLHPLYIDEDRLMEQYPGQFPFTRGIYKNGYMERPWRICQPVSGEDGSAANRNMHAALSRGQDVITFSEKLLLTPAEELFKELNLEELPIFIDTNGKWKEFTSSFLEYCQKQNISKEEIKGALAEDPIAGWAEKGLLPEETDIFFDGWFNDLKEKAAELPRVRFILIKAESYHNAGADAVQELAYSLAEAVQYLEEGKRNGQSIEDLARSMIFSYAIDSMFFLNIAKLRAGRRLFALLAQAYEVDPEAFKMEIHAVTSSLMETLFDKHVNILRAANAAFSAALAGIQYLQVRPFDSQTEQASSLGERLARNTQLILKEETHITRVTDPAGGSWYVEDLTDELADRAWKLFVEIQNAGGILAILKNGSLQHEVDKVYSKRLKNAAERKASIIGTNVYANLAEQIESSPAFKAETRNAEGECMAIPPLKSRRIAEEYESLRLQAINYKKQTGEFPKIGIVNVGKLKAYKQRMDFIRAMAAAGGVDTLESPGCLSLGEVLDFIKNHPLPVYCLCGSDEEYSETAKSIVEAIKTQLPGCKVYLAGQQPDSLTEQLTEAGVSDFISIKKNAVVWLRNLMQDLEVTNENT